MKKEVDRLEKSPILIGHSMGGLIVQKYLEEHTCKKAILLASVPPYGVINTTLRFAKKSYFYSSLVGLDLYGLVNTEQKSKEAFFSNDISNEALKEFTSNLCSESFKAFLAMLFPRIRKTKNSDIPMLVIGAKNDSIFTVKDNIKTSAKYNAELIMMENIAHDMMLDVNHEKVSKQIIDWLEIEPKMQSTQRVNM